MNVLLRPPVRGLLPLCLSFLAALAIPCAAHAQDPRGAITGVVSDTSGGRLPGVTVVNQDGLVAVLHADPEAAEKALAAIKAEWDIPQPAFDDQTVFDYIVKNAPKPQQRAPKGDLAAGEKAAATIFEEKYLNGYGAHGSTRALGGYNTTSTTTGFMNGDAWTLPQIRTAVKQGMGIQRDDDLLLVR